MAPFTCRFATRSEAGQLLAQRMTDLPMHDPIVVALPRGGVPVAAEVAKALHAKLDILLVRKIGAPSQPELALAAVADGDPPQLVVDAPVQVEADVSSEWLKQAMDVQLREIERRREVYLRGRSQLSLKDHDVVLVDDGIATGTTMRAAIASVRRQHPSRIIVAVPVASTRESASLRAQVDALVCLKQPAWLIAIGDFYDDFHQLSDREVIECMDETQFA